MNGRPTDHRNINLRQLHLDILHGKANGRVLWQPRILCWYDDRIFSKTPFPEPYTGLSVKELYEALGCSNRIYDYNIGIGKRESSSIVHNHEKIDELRTKETITTPVGSIFQVYKANTSNYGVYTEKWFVENEDDLRVLMYMEENSEYFWNQEGYEKARDFWGDNGEGSIYFPRTTVQSFFNETTGVENGIYALLDYPDLCEEYFKIRHKNEMDFCHVLAKSPLEWINFADNIHCATLPPNLFEKYVLPEYQARNEILLAADKYTYAHWDGNTKTLLPYAKETGLRGIEAITPEPQGDVTIEEIKEALGDEVDLIDGIPAILFNETYSEKELIDTTKKLIDLFAGHLILGISDEMSSTGDINRIRLVGDIVDDYNASL